MPALVIGNVRNFQIIMQDGVMVRVYCVDWKHIFIIRYFSQPPIKDAVYGTTLHCYGSFAQIGAARATKVVPDTIKGEVYELF